MSGIEDDSAVETLAEELEAVSLLDEVKARHKREVKELEGKAAKMKHSVPKGDKKKFKQVQSEIAALALELSNRQAAELKKAEETDRAENQPSAAKTDSTGETDAPSQPASIIKNSPAKASGKTRSQRRRENKKSAAAEKKQHDLESIPSESARDREHSMISSRLEKLGLAIHDVAPDGDCLFSAIMHQLTLKGIDTTVNSLRFQAAEVMRDNVDEYLPFATIQGSHNEDSEEVMDEVGFMLYCDILASKHEWGGQLELKALSQALRMPVQVVQADGPDMIIGDLASTNESPLVLTYHRHEFGLGEHYNSTESWHETRR